MQMQCGSIVNTNKKQHCKSYKHCGCNAPMVKAPTPGMELHGESPPP